MFYKLRGLEEAQRFSLLKECVDGGGDLEELSQTAGQAEGELEIKEMFVRCAGTSCWEEAQQLYPEHTTSEALSPFRGRCRKCRSPCEM